MLKAAATPVSTSLDAFIARANEELVEVAASPFKPEHREGVLRRELDELQAKFAAAEARAAAAEARAAAAEARALAASARPADRRGSARWGLTIAAFLIGGAAMFAVSLIRPGKEQAVAPASTPVVTSPTAVTPPGAAVSPAAATSPGAAVSPAAATSPGAAVSPAAASPTVTPITPPATGLTVVPLADPGPVAPTPVTPTPVAVPEQVGDKVTKKPVAKPARRPAAREDGAAIPKPPADDLYNPF